MVIVDEKIIEEYKTETKLFMTYLRGYTHNNPNAMTEVSVYFGKIEELIFGKVLN